jgi:hypothetical protein
MNHSKNLFSIVAVAIVAAVAVWSLRPKASSPGMATSSRLYSIPVPNKSHPSSFSETIAATGFVTVPNASFNSLLPPSQRNPGFEAIPAFRRTELLSSDARLLGYRSGDATALLYVQTSGSPEHVQSFQRETEALRAQLSK